MNHIESKDFKLTLLSMRFGALILSVFLLVVQFRMTIVQLEYVLNKDFIVAELCIEREIENSTCAGKCHLKKELEKVEVDSEPDDRKIPQRAQLEELRFIDNDSDESVNTIFVFSVEVTDNIISHPTSSGYSSLYLPPPELS